MQSLIASTACKKAPGPPGPPEALETWPGSQCRNAIYRLPTAGTACPCPELCVLCAQACSEHNLRLVGHAHDGDPKLRKATYQLFRKHPSRLTASTPEDACITVDHALVQMFIPRVGCNGVQHRYALGGWLGWLARSSR